MYLQLVSRVVDDLHCRLFISSGPPTVPTLSCVDSSEDVSGAVNVTVSWTLSGGDSADFYLISITTNAPQTPYGGLLNITTSSVTQHELTGFMTGYEYSITVRGVTANCGGLVGRESEPLTITPQGKRYWQAHREGGEQGLFPQGSQTFRGPHEALTLLPFIFTQFLYFLLSIALSALNE